MSELQAGRALDALIAEKVMDEPEYWSVHFSGSHYGDFKTRAEAETCAKQIQGDYKAHVQTFFDCPRYSTSIAAAWQVVEKLGNWHGFDFCLWLKSDANGQWHAGWFENGYDGLKSRCSAMAEAAPLAICLAALKAKEI